MIIWIDTTTFYKNYRLTIKYNAHIMRSMSNSLKSNRVSLSDLPDLLTIREVADILRV